MDIPTAWIWQNSGDKVCSRSCLLLNIIQSFPTELKTKTKHNSLVGSVSPCTICPLLPSQGSKYTVLSLTIFQLYKQPSHLFICSTNVPSFLPPCASPWFAIYTLENQDSWWDNLVPGLRIKSVGVQGQEKMDVQFKQRTSFALRPPFCPIQELNRLNSTDWWGWSHLLSLIQMLISVRETPTDTSRNTLPVVWAPLTQTSWYVRLIIICCCPIAKSCPTFHDPMDCSMPGFPVPHHLPEFAQVHVFE